jgi:hypothetical protein
LITAPLVEKMGDMEAVALALMEATQGSAMPGEGLGGVRVEEEQD